MRKYFPAMLAGVAMLLVTPPTVFAQEEAELLRYLGELGLHPDAHVSVQQVAPFEGPLTVLVDDVPQFIGHKVASKVYVHAENA